MSVKPLKPCGYPGCPALVKDGAYCDQHKRQYDRQRGTANRRGYTYQWQQYIIRYKRKHPLCCKCEAQGIVKPTYAVDHIIPVSGPDDPLFWVDSNHQPLCLSCHSVKTAKENGGFGNTRK